MRLILKTLKGRLSLDQAIEARVEEIKAIGQRSSSFTLKTVRGEGFAQTELYPARKRRDIASMPVVPTAEDLP